MKTDEEIAIAEPFNRLNDAYFKSVMASSGRKHITIAFLNAVMSHVYSDGHQEIDDVEFLDREAVSVWEGAKVPRFDVFLRATFKNRDLEAKLCHIEVQDAKDKFFMKHGFYYACHDYAGQSRRGLNYENFEPIVFVGLLNFRLDDTEGVHEWYNLHRVLNNATHECSIGLMELHMAELSLLRQKWRKFKHEPSTKFEELMFYFGGVGGKNMGNTLVQEIAERNPVVAELLDYEQRFRMDPLLMRQYVMAERAHIDYLDNLKIEREEGVEEGIGKGQELKAFEVARNLRAKGIMTNEEIAQVAGIPVEVVRSL